MTSARTPLARLFCMDWRTRTLARTVLLSVLVGLLAGLSARGLSELLALGTGLILDRYPNTDVHSVGAFSWQRLLAPGLMGLICGIVLYRLLRLTDRQGTESYVYAFHHGRSRLDFRVPLIKALAAVGVISCGGSVGPEGPIAALGGGIGSSVSRKFGMSSRSMRGYLIAGCAGGVGAIFQCPLGGALFASTLMYREPHFEAKSLMKAIICSVIAYAVFIAFKDEGHHLLDNANTLRFESPVHLIWFLLLGLACAAATATLWASVRLTEHIRERSNIPIWLWPAIGGLLVGAIACVLPQVMDWHYALVQTAMDEALSPELFSDLEVQSWAYWALLFGCIVGAKCLATGITVGSANAGGLLGPVLFIGGMTGATLGAALQAVHPELITPQLQAALIPIGMAGMLSASMRSPIASIVMVLEMTGSYDLIVPSMVVCAAAYILGRYFGLNPEQLRSPVESPAHAAEPILDLLESIRVDEVMAPALEHLAVPSTPWPEVVRRLGSMPEPVLYVVRDGRLQGQITVAQVHQQGDDPLFEAMIIAEDLLTPVVGRLYSSMPLLSASRVLAQHGASVLPVLEEGRGGRVLGVLRRADIHRILRQRLSSLHDLAKAEESGIEALDRETHLVSLAQGMGSQEQLRIREVPAPADVVGKSLRESDFRARHQMQVLGIRGGDGSLRIPADPNQVLQNDDLLLVVPAAGE
jgi:chloride channel protein, CIC family